MKKTIILFAFSFLMFSCGNPSPKENTTDISSVQSSTIADQSKIGRTNYAVVWNWTTTDAQLVNDNLTQISAELTGLWKDDFIENAYYDADSPVDKFENFANIAFFLKAYSETEAKTILNKLTVVQKKIGAYQLHPVGQLWLDRKSDVINKQGVTNSYVTIWTTLKSPLQGKNADNLLQEQNDKMIELWNQGKLENVYFDIEGTYEASKKTEFVFFVNANTQAEAEAICNSLPFAREKMASFRMIQAGVFWMGQNKNN